MAQLPDYLASPPEVEALRFCEDSDVAEARFMFRFGSAEELAGVTEAVKRCFEWWGHQVFPIPNLGFFTMVDGKPVFTVSITQYCTHKGWEHPSARITIARF